MKKYIDKFTAIVLLFETSLFKEESNVVKMYNSIGKTILSEGCINIDKNKIEYKFHGSGCKLVVDNKVKLDYDFVPINRNSIKFSPFYFTEFLNSIQNLKNYNTNEVDNILMDMVNKGVITKCDFPFNNYEIERK